MNRLIFASALLSASGGTGNSKGPMHRAGLEWEPPFPLEVNNCGVGIGAGARRPLFAIPLCHRHQRAVERHLSQPELSAGTIQRRTIQPCARRLTCISSVSMSLYLRVPSVIICNPVRIWRFVRRCCLRAPQALQAVGVGPPVCRGQQRAPVVLGGLRVVGVAGLELAELLLHLVLDEHPIT